MIIENMHNKHCTNPPSSSFDITPLFYLVFVFVIKCMYVKISIFIMHFILV